MADEDKDDVARALEQMSSGRSSAPKPRPTPQPKARPAAPVARPAAPTTPPLQTPKSTIGRLGSEDLASLSIKSSTATKRKKVRALPLGSGMGLRRTLIPILLTGGLLLVALASTRFLWNSVDNPTLDLPLGVVFGMYAVALICWLLAAANMVAVRRQLRNAETAART